MINLLPPDIKNQIAFSKRNSKMIKLISTLGFTCLVLGGLFFVGLKYLDKRNSDMSAELNDRVNSPANEIEKTVQGINEKLTTIKRLRQNRHNYSEVLRDIGRALPAGAFIREINLTGDEKPLKLNVVTSSYGSATRVRDALAKMEDRVSAVDIESIGSDSGGFLVVVNIAFKKGGNR